MTENQENTKKLNEQLQKTFLNLSNLIKDTRRNTLKLETKQEDFKSDLKKANEIQKALLIEIDELSVRDVAVKQNNNYQNLIVNTNDILKKINKEQNKLLIETIKLKEKKIIQIRDEEFDMQLHQMSIENDFRLAQRDMIKTQDILEKNSLEILLFAKEEAKTNRYIMISGIVVCASLIIFLGL